MKKTAKPIRCRKFRKDASIASVTRFIEQNFGLPVGSIRIEYPSGRKARTDSAVEYLLKSWEVESVGTETPPAPAPEEPKQMQLADIFEKEDHG